MISFGEKIDHSSFFLHHHYVTHPMTPPPLRFMMRFWEPIKKRLNNAGHMTAIRKKAVTGMELVVAGGLLTGHSVLMERLTSPASPQISGHDITYNSDTSPAIIKFELLQSGSKGPTKMSTPEIVGWILFGTILIILAIPIVKAMTKF